MFGVKLLMLQLKGVTIQGTHNGANLKRRITKNNRHQNWITQQLTETNPAVLFIKLS